MSDLTKEHLEELTALVNERIEELGLPPTVTFGNRLSHGIVRIAHDVIKRWYEEKEESWAMQRISEVTITAEMAMKLSKQGYDVGYAAAQSAMDPAREEAADKRTLIVDPPATNGSALMMDGTEQTPEPDDDPYGIRSMFSEKPDAPPIAPPQAPMGVLSPAAAATLGPEHGMVTPLKVTGRTLEEADRALMCVGLNSEEKSAILRDIIAELQMLSANGEMPTMAIWDERKPPSLPKAPTALLRYGLTWGKLAEYANLKYEGRRSTLQKGDA